jgi:hypothetical protein
VPLLLRQVRRIGAPTLEAERHRSSALDQRRLR